MTNNNISKITISGNLTKAPRINEVVNSMTGEIQKVANFTVAKNFIRRDGTKDVTYYDVALWDSDVEKVANLTTKNLVCIDATDVVAEPWTGRDGQVRVNNKLKGITGVRSWNNAERKWDVLHTVFKAQSAQQAIAQPAARAESPAPARKARKARKA